MTATREPVGSIVIGDKGVFAVGRDADACAAGRLERQHADETIGRQLEPGRGVQPKDLVRETRGDIVERGAFNTIQINGFGASLNLNPSRYDSSSESPHRSHMVTRTLLLPTALVIFVIEPATAQDHRVYHVPIRGAVELESVNVVRRAIAVAERAGAATIVLDIASPGGRFDLAQLIVGEIEATPVPVVVYVSSDAWDAGALVALAADSIFMGAGSTIGAGEDPSARDLPAVALRAMRNAFGDVAERHRHGARLAEAMVDADIAIDGVVRAGELLILGADAAVEVGLATASVVDLEALLDRLELSDSETATVAGNWIGTTVQVTNRNWGDVRVFISRSGNRFRLGTVTSMNTAEFEIPQGQLGQGAFIRVVVEVIGGFEGTATEEIRVRPGLMIDWTIENVLNQSKLFVYQRS